jgi:SAM-dependent methyltransferase
MNEHSDTYWEPSDLEEVGSCPICASTEARILYTSLPDQLLRNPGHWSLKECADCRGLYLAIRPTRQAIGKAYDESYATHIDQASTNAADNGNTFSWRLINGYLNRRFDAGRQPSFSLGGKLLSLLPPFRHQLDYFYRHLPPTKGRLLDIGCGNGQFLRRVREAGWDVMGIESNPVSVKNAEKVGLHVLETGFEATQGNGDFDVVTASHVIEHVHDPLALLVNMKNHVRDGGQIWLATPNAQSICHRIFGKFWYHLDPPRHLQLFSREGLTRLLRQAGFSGIRFHPRGRGNSRWVIRCSAEYAARSGRKPLFTPWHVLVDVIAGFSTALPEELIVTAVK